MIHFYGAPNSSAGRTHLMLEECGVAYEHHAIDLRDPASKAELVAVNPLGRVPFIVDGELRLAESIAINCYLAERYAPALWATAQDDRARLWSWSLWAIATLQPECARVMRHTFLLPPAERVAAEVAHGKAAVQRELDHLERALPASGYLVADKFTVADLNVLSTVNLCVAFGAGTLGPKSAAYLDALKARPAYQRLVASSTTR